MRTFLRAFVAMTVVASACANEDRDPAVESFTGRWLITEGEIEITCPGADPFAVDPQGATFDNVAIDDTHFEHTDAGGCVLDFIVAGKRADMLPDQPCMATDAMGQVHSEMKSSLVFELVGEGMLEAAGDGVSDGLCISTLTASATRQSRE